MKSTVLMRKRLDKSLSVFMNAAILVLSTSLEERGHQNLLEGCFSHTMLQLVCVKLHVPSSNYAEALGGFTGLVPKQMLWELFRSRLPLGRAVANKMKLALDL